jgi:hypothetical protein
MQQVLDHLGNALAMNQTDFLNIFFSLLLALVIGFVVSQVYKHTHRGLSFELAFMSTLVVLAPIVSTVMLFIRGDLVLSLGLIGSLSIIRFRTPIKDTRDMVFLFWVIAVGLGCGTFNWSAVILSSIVITIVMFLFHFFKYGQTNKTDFVLVVHGYGNFSPESISSIIKKYVKDAQIRSKEVEVENWEVVYEVRLGKQPGETADLLIEELKKTTGVSKVSILAPQIALPV